MKGDYTKVESGDCIVAFSKADIFSIKATIEQSTSHKCCVIYGQLPPETRSNQARLFNSQSNGYDILVASDAIGMGLNLNIRRIIFHSTLKAGIKSELPEFLRPTAIKQIGGRAGRVSSNYQFGEVTAWQEQDLAYIKAAMSLELDPIRQAGIAPSAAQLFRFSDHLTKIPTSFKPSSSFDFRQANGEIERDVTLDTTSNSSESISGSHTLSSTLERFFDLSQMSNKYFLCHQDQIKIISNWLDPIPLSLADRLFVFLFFHFCRYIFATSPVNLRDTLSMNVLYTFAAHFAQHRPVPLTIRIPQSEPQSLSEFSDLCFKHDLLDLYIWLSHYFPKCFIEGTKCKELKDISLHLIQYALENANIQQDYSYTTYYQSLRNKVPKENGFPVQFSSLIRAVYVSHLNKMPADKWAIFCESSSRPSQRKRSIPKISSPRMRISKPSSLKNLQRLVTPQSKVVRTDDGKLQIYRQLEELESLGEL